jgi:hypothetical protein
MELTLQVGLFYSSFVVEIAGVWFTLRKGWHRYISSTKIAVRYGAFTLIIL